MGAVQDGNGKFGEERTFISIRASLSPGRVTAQSGGVGKNSVATGSDFAHAALAFEQAKSHCRPC
jgi:hypothetical protein